MTPRGGGGARRPRRPRRCGGGGAARPEVHDLGERRAAVRAHGVLLGFANGFAPPQVDADAAELVLAAGDLAILLAVGAELAEVVLVPRRGRGRGRRRRDGGLRRALRRWRRRRASASPPARGRPAALRSATALRRRTRGRAAGRARRSESSQCRGRVVALVVEEGLAEVRDAALREDGDFFVG